jgi:beta-1,2-mannobiose phosphorylase / 1,2-beta-oligomannan phosphorylase
MSLVKRSKNNPIIWPNRENSWEAEATFNGCALREPKRVDLFYRAESLPERFNDIEIRVSSIGRAESADGVHFTGREQLIVPQHDWEKFGCEDPRATKFEGKYYIFYTALSKYPFDPEGIKVGVAVGKDLKEMEKHPVTTFNSKAMALFPGRVKGKMAALVTANTDRPPARIGLAFFDDEEDIWSPAFWDEWYSELDAHIIPLQRNENDHIELGAPPILTDRGWLIVYSYIRNYFHGTRIFGIEAALLDANDPRKIISRTDRPFMVPDQEYELYGRVPNVIFPAGAFVKNGVLNIYYGAADTTCCLATCKLSDLMDELDATATKLVRAKENPIIEPDRSRGWEAKGTFNPGAIFAKGKMHILYRALSDDDTSVLGYAASADGLRIDEKLDEPAYVPREAFEMKQRPGVGSGCEDPRLTIINDKVYMCYTAYNGVDVPRIALSSIALKDFVEKKWDWSKPVLISPPGIDDKDAAIFPKKINGKYAILHRIGHSIWLDFVKDLNEFQGEKWVEGKVLMQPRESIWDSRKIGIGPPPIETPEGWLILYHGVSKRDDNHYHVRAALLDIKNPSKVLARTVYPIFEPEMPYERNGLVPNVIFPCGAVSRKGILYVYYGGADKVVGVATISVKKLLQRLLSERKKPATAKTPAKKRKIKK